MDTCNRFKPQTHEWKRGNKYRELYACACIRVYVLECARARKRASVDAAEKRFICFVY